MQQRAMVRCRCILSGNADVPGHIVVERAPRPDALEVELWKVVAAIYTDGPTRVMRLVVVKVEVHVAFRIPDRRTDLGRVADLEVDAGYDAIGVAEVTAGALIVALVTPIAEARDPYRVELESAASYTDLRHGLQLLRDDVLQKVLNDQLVLDLLTVLGSGQLLHD